MRTYNPIWETVEDQNIFEPVEDLIAHHEPIQVGSYTIIPKPQNGGDWSHLYDIFKNKTPVRKNLNITEVANFVNRLLRVKWADHSFRWYERVVRWVRRQYYNPMRFWWRL